MNIYVEPQRTQQITKAIYREKKKDQAGAFTCIDFKTHYNDSVTKKCIS